mgnify:CR=1 FL=1
MKKENNTKKTVKKEENTNNVIDKNRLKVYIITIIIIDILAIFNLVLSIKINDINIMPYILLFLSNSLIIAAYVKSKKG